MSDQTKERCPECDSAARHANSDATSPGFFFDKCEKHRVGHDVSPVIADKLRKHQNFCGDCTNFSLCPKGEIIQMESVAPVAPACTGFEVTIHAHTKEALDAITSPEALRFQIGHMLDSWKIAEEIDYTLEVRRIYE